MKKHLGKIRIALQLGAGTLLVAGGLANLPVTLLIILVTTVLAGPFFCGWVCPFGTLQDLISQLTKGIKKRKMPKKLQKGLVATRYILMAVTTLLTFDFIFTLMQYDPRINLLSILDGKWLTMGAYVIIGIYLLIAIFFERPFCNYMCPQGAKYGLVSTLRPFRIVRDSNLCVDCGKCNKVCPMNIDIMNHNNVKSLQCINCMSCVAACPKKGALKFEILKLSRKSAAAYFLAVSVILATSTVAMALQFTANQEAEQNVENEVAMTLQEEAQPSNMSEAEVAPETTGAVTEAPIVNEEAATTNADATTAKAETVAATTETAAVTTKSATKTNTTNTTAAATAPQSTNTTQATTTAQSTTSQPTTPAQTTVAATGAAAGIADGTYTGQGQGFKGTVTVSVTVKDQQILSVDVLDNNDDRKWFNRAMNSIPGWIIDAQSTDVDTVSGATYSSRGIINAAKDALNNAK